MIVRNHNQVFLVIAFLIILFHWSCKKENNSKPNNPETYFPKVRSIVQTNCTVSCHAPSRGFSQGLPVILESDGDIVNQSASIKTSVADPVTPVNKRMPLGGSLSTSDIDVITKWLAKGGKATD